MTALNTSLENRLAPKQIGSSDGILMLFLGAAWLASVWPGMVNIFKEAMTNEEASHILLVPLIAAYIGFQRKALIAQTPLSIRWPGVFISLLGVGLSEYGYVQYFKSVEQLGYLVVGLGMVVIALGWRILLPLWPVLVVMLFLIPVPGRIRAEIAIPLQAWTAQITEYILLGFGIDLYRLGNVLHVNGQPVGIAEACNGARMVYAVFLVCYSYALTSSMRPWAQVCLLVLSPAIAIGCNIARVIPTVLMYGFSSEQAAGVFHDLAGWGVIALAFGVIHVIAKLGIWLGLPIQNQSEEQQHRKPVPGRTDSGAHLESPAEA